MRLRAVVSASSLCQSQLKQESDMGGIVVTTKAPAGLCMNYDNTM